MIYESGKLKLLRRILIFMEKDIETLFCMVQIILVVTLDLNFGLVP